MRLYSPCHPFILKFLNLSELAPTKVREQVLSIYLLLSCLVTSFSVSIFFFVLLLLASSTSSSTPFTPFLHSTMPLPRDFITSGSLLPKIRSATIRMISHSQPPGILNILMPPYRKFLEYVKLYHQTNENQ